MKTLEFGNSIELSESQGRLIELISKGEWNQIAPEVLRSLVPDAQRFLEFLAKNDLSGTDEAKAVLKQLGIAQATKTPLPKAAGAGKGVPWKEQRSLTGWYSKRVAAAAKGPTSKVKRRKGKKSRSTPRTNRPVKA